MTRSGSLRISLRGREVEPDLRRLTATIPLRGTVTLAYEREPDFFHALDIEGDDRHVAVADEGQHIAGFATQSLSMRYVNGEAALTAYLGMARVEHHLRQRQVSPQAFHLFREAQKERGVQYVFASVVRARSGQIAFPASPQKGIPGFRPMADLCTLVFPVRRSHAQLRLPKRIRLARESEIGSLVDCLNRNNCSFQFSEVWTSGNIRDGLRTRGLEIKDFLVASESGRIQGCVALWDQRAFKQTRVIDYPAPLGLARPVVNALSNMLGKPKMPAPGGLFEQVFLSLLAIDEDDVDLTLELLRAARIEAARRGKIDNLAMGIFVDDLRINAIRKVTRGLSYRSTICQVVWPDMEQQALMKGQVRAEVALM